MSKPDPVTCVKCGKPYSSFAHNCGEGLGAMPCSRFSFVDVTTEGSEGTLNLFFDDYPVAWVNNLHVAQQIREFLSENAGGSATEAEE